MHVVLKPFHEQGRTQGGFKKKTFQSGAQDPLGPENPLEIIDFTDPWGAAGWAAEFLNVVLEYEFLPAYNLKYHQEKNV